MWSVVAWRKNRLASFCGSGSAKVSYRRDLISFNLDEKCD